MADEGEKSLSSLYIKGLSFTFGCVPIIVFAYLITITVFERASFAVATMRDFLSQQGLIRAALLSTIFATEAVGTAIRRTTDCHSNHYPGPVNPSFETGLAHSIKSGKIFSGDLLNLETLLLGSFAQAPSKRAL
jgi:hypothetical protein